MITAENANEGDFGGAGSLTVAEGDKILIEPDIEGEGTIHIDLGTMEAGEDATAEELSEAMDPKEAVYSADIGGTEPIEVELAAGDYIVNATANGKVTGTIKISVKSGGIE